MLLLNVYLPCDLQTNDALESYREALALLSVVIQEQNTNHVILMGDCNADPSKGRFWDLLNDFTRSLSLRILNDRLPSDTFTYLCPSRNITSWLDHVICTSKLNDMVMNISVNYDRAIFDHFPLSCSLNIHTDVFCFNDAEKIIHEFVNWNRMTSRDREIIKQFIDSEIMKKKLLDSHSLSCLDLNCSHKNHRIEMLHIFESIKCILLEATDKFKFTNEKRFKVIPGWNDNVKHLHQIARESFLLWKERGRPPHGQFVEDMKKTRANFRAALKFCKDNEADLRSKKLLENFRLKNYKGFWRDVAEINKHNMSYPTEIDNKNTNVDICHLFSRNYESIFNKKKGLIDNVKLNVTNKKKIDILLRFSIEDVKKSIRSLKVTLGFDKIHSNHLKFDSVILIDLLARLFTGFIVHSFVPVNMLRGIITPIVKDKFGDLSSSNNYRPVMTSSVFLKIFEYCLSDKICPYVKLNDRQHGFRKSYSTATACFTLKETVMYYTQASSNVYACFLDLRKAFDSVNHNTLFYKMQLAGIPDCIINVIKFWYCNQYAQVKYQNIMSNEWKINNGVRQGGVLSGLLFNIYVNSLIEKISNLNIGCKLGTVKSNIIAYADDIVLLSPTRSGLKSLLLETHTEASCMDLKFNFEKTKIIKFHSNTCKPDGLVNKPLIIGEHSINFVSTFKYLGYMIANNLNNNEDIARAKSKFYSEFNSILRKFHFTNKEVKLFLFKQYCLQFYGSELWFGPLKSKQAIKQFAIGYHKAVKKILQLSMHESNHFACQEAGLMTFNHLLNKMKICSVIRFILEPCDFIRKLLSFIKISSVLIKDVKCVLKTIYDIDSVFDNDVEAIISRILFVQRNEEQMRVTW